MEDLINRFAVPSDSVTKFLVNKADHNVVPLYFVENEVTIHNNIAEIRFIQYYFNKEEDPIEAQYVFPVHNDCTFTDLEIRYGEEIVKANVEERKKAKVIYDDAIAQGKTAVMGKQTLNSEELIGIDIGNLPPRSEVIVVCTFHQVMQVDDCSWKLHIPSKIMPRYMGDLAEYVKTGKHLKGMVEDLYNNTPEDRVEILSEQAASYYNSPTFNWKITVKINSQSPIHRIISRSHDSFNMKIDFDDEGNTRATIQFEEEEHMSFFDKDFILMYRNNEINKPMLLIQKRDKEYALMVSMLADINPDQKWKLNEEEKIHEIDLDPNVFYEEEFEGDMEPAEFIFLLDRSYSMTGRPMETAKSSLILFLHSLPPGSQFNVISFGNDYETIFECTVPYTQENMEYATSRIKAFGADMGGTEILRPLRHIFDNKSDTDLQRHVFLLTDGAVFDPKVCVKLISQNSNEFIVHTIGIGKYVSTQLIIECAAVGNGGYYFVYDYVEDLEDTVIESLCKCFEDKIKIIAKDLSVNFSKKDESPSLESIASRIHNGKYFTYFCILEGKEEEKLEGTLSFDLSSKLEGTQKYLFDLENDVQIIEGDSIFKMFGNSKIKELEDNEGSCYKATQYAIDYQIPSKYTSLIAVKKLMADPSEKYSRMVKYVKEGPIGFSIKTLTGKILRFTANSDLDIGSLKCAIERNEGIPPDQQVIVYDSIQTEDDETLGDYGVQTGDMLYLLLRLRGGGEKLTDSAPGADSDWPLGDSTYKEFVEIQHVNGSWDYKVLDLVGLTEDQVYDAAPENIKNLGDKEKVLTIMLTWIGINRIKTLFPEKQKSLKLVVKKAITFITAQTELSVTYDDIKCSLF
ncbi:unnamed protein product [Moneuplotes crassus]|uniref:Uncharacterized protein n=1 Tax=Euplotes crassus TaxID=5936 RepID=A0AAD1XUI4_EUPCR|nr:unnamed protein product [Moneuplotes crassus]